MTPVASRLTPAFGARPPATELGAVWGKGLVWSMPANAPKVAYGRGLRPPAYLGD